MSIFRKHSMPSWWMFVILLLFSVRFFPDYVMVKLSLNDSAWNTAMNAISIPPKFSGWIWIVFAIDIAIMLLQIFYIKNSDKKADQET